ncbi:MAG: hydrogenase formation protein HypD [Acidobacteria bacterium]|nr:hydrogenase formation protein HypD [Acidobacteriota bacterium]
MSYLKQFRDPAAISALLAEIGKVNDPTREYSFMEVCGTHTMSIFRYGIRSVLPKNIRLLSGPGCPVCVTDIGYVDAAIDLAGREDVIITTFGDMLRVPGSGTSLYHMRAEGSDIRIVYSPADAVGIAKKETAKKVIFLAVGFETTTPTIAGSIKIAADGDVGNYFILPGNKTMPNAMSALAGSGELKLDGFICPPHVSAITGTKLYDFLAADYGKSCVVGGFEPTDILQTVLMLMKQVNEGRAEVENQYSRVVTREGNIKATELVDSIFEPADAVWRGLGVIPGSGLTSNAEYSRFDALKEFDITMDTGKDNPGCICGDVLTGRKTPKDCKLFGKACLPENPQGACMVSSEGTCAAYYKYNIE